MNMSKLKLQIITPKKVVLEADIVSITAPAKDGEITVLPHHIPLFTLLKEGIVKIKQDSGESLVSIGGGYLETDGKVIHLLVSSAYHQDEIDEQEINKAHEEAKRKLQDAPSEKDRHEAMTMLRRSLVDIKLLQKIKKSKRNL